ncbi:MAG: DNA gyrase subunit A, partial [Gammaproteobacteria bacterium]|nr:DNA gyrase subunit A [Gammaproteobacteria bacterium]
TLSHAGYAKAQPVSEYRAQRRGGRGKMATRTKDEDFVSRLFVANTHDTILCFSSHGKVYWLKVYQLPQAGRISRGRPLVNLLPLAEDEQVTSLLPVRGYEQGGFVVMATADGTIKKTSLGDFSRPRTAGIRAIDLNDGNNLVGVGLTTGDSDLLLVSNAGKAIRFNESDLRPMGRTARGVRGLRLKAGQRVISLITVRRDDSAGIQVLLGTENGYGKRTKLDEFAARKRGGQGVIAIQVKGRNGEVVGAQAVAQEDEIMLITDGGTLIRTRVSEISTQGRNTQGVRLIDLHEEEALVGIGKVEESGSNGDVDE